MLKRLTLRQPLGDPQCPYAHRWMINLGRLGSLRLHQWHRSDDKRAKHDHPSDFVTLVLKGSYTDLGRRDSCPTCNLKQPDCPDCHFEEEMTPGMIRRRAAEHRHTVDVHPGGCWTLLYFWPERRKWGFYVPGATRKLKFLTSDRYFRSQGHHPCSQP